MHLYQNDIEAATNRKLGFADHVRVLKYKRLNNGATVCLINSVTMSYYTPKGKPRMKPVNRYMIYILNDEACWYVRIKSGNKADMLRSFNSLIKKDAQNVNTKR